VFFDRLGTSSKRLPPTSKNLTRRRQLAALGLAATMALPTGALNLARLCAADTPATGASTDTVADSVQAAQKLMDQGQYDAAEESLRQINTFSLSDADRHLVLDALSEAAKGAEQSRAARNELALGRQAVAADRRVEAREHFNAVIGNRFADAATRKSAQDEMTRLDGGAPAQVAADSSTTQPAPTTAPSSADAAVPAIESNPTTAPAVAVAPAPAPQPPAPSGADYYHLAQQQYRKGDWIAARQNFTAAEAANYKPGLFEGESPAKYLARMDAKESADKAAADAEIARQQQLQAAHAQQVAVVSDVPPPAPPAPPAEAAAPTTAPAEAMTPATVPAEAVAPTAPPAEAVAPTTAPAVAMAPTTEPAEAATAPAVAPVATEDQAALDDLRATQKAQEILRQQNEYEAQQLVQKAADARLKGDLADSQDLYTQAVNLDPDNPQAKAGLNEVLILRGRNPVATPALAQQARENKVEIAEINYAFDKAINDARDDIAKGDFTGADTALQRALIVSQQHPQIFTADALKSFDDQIRAVRLSLDQAMERAKADAAAKGDQDSAARLAKQEADNKAQQVRTIADLRATAIDETNHQRYREALGVVDQILTLDPNDDYATGVRPLLEDKYNFQQQRIFMERRDLEQTSQFIRSDEELIPYDDIVRYPTDWPDISQTRDQTVQSERGEDKEDRAVEAQLDRALPEVAFDGVGFSDVIDFLRDVSGANIFVNWKTLEGAGVDRNAPVTAKLRNVKFSKALSIILDSVGGGTAKLGYTIDEGVIEIGTADDLSKNTLTRVYDIRDLIINVPDFNNAPDFSLTSTSNNTSQNGGAGGGGGGGGGQGQSLFTGGGGGQGGQQEGQTRQELVDSITKLITETVAPDSWRDSGGSVGSLRELQGQLIVTQTPENQRALVSLLEQLRETHSIQVTVETRFLTVQRNFLQDIGVDLNFIFNLNSSNSANISTIPLQAANSAFTSAPTTTVPGSIGATAEGLTTAVTYLDNLQVNLLLHATEASQLTTKVDSPRVTLFNGQRAYVLNSLQQAYVSDLTPIVGTGVAAFNPTISVVQSGVLLDVQATVSADRKYVTLTLRPQLSELVALVPFSFQTGSTTTIVDGVPVTTGQTGTIEQPEIQLTEVRTTVSVPDGGTLLLGGETQAGEVEKEVGTPILSKIPFLKRLFTNRSYAKDEEVLLILVKPTIIIEREIEQKQFPLLTSKLGS